MSHTELIETVVKLTHAYFSGWKQGDWERVRNTLSTDVRFEDPGML